MKKIANKVSLDLEMTGTIAGLVIMVLTVAAFLNYKDGQKVFIVIFMMGTVLNGIMAGVSFVKLHKLRSIFYGVAALIFLSISIVQLIGLWRT